ncbi:hypothetical protein LLEC1_00124 [Akanthomyces lecanii]|uniref:CWH43-like N-terminal domain-containing protein n=1 Tax=Cordyceps confragosa TaxID=2714763 RepID=A0A179I3K7_CORDF|nr:hypothetical protein LLEC1_00124 [Akanthomyces lecanii]
MAVRGWISFWWLPIISALVWFGMLLGMLLHWIINDHGRPYDYQNQDIRIVFISNIGADVLKPLFIAGSCVVCLFLDLSMLTARWLRHRGRLHHRKLHYLFLLFFLAGYMLSAICTCWEYQRLGIKHRDHRDLRTSFWAKLVVVLVEVSLAIAFVATNFTSHDNVAAVLEWVVAFLFSFFILSFVIDLYPAVATKPHMARYGKRSPHEMEEASDATTPHHYANGNTPNTTGAY